MLSNFLRFNLVKTVYLFVLIAVVGCSPDDAPAPKGSSPTKSTTGTTKSKSKTAGNEADFFPLQLNEDFKMFPGETAPDGVAWKSEGDVIVCKGEPKGYIYTTEVYEDFTIRFDYMFPSPADEKKLNTGLLVYIGDQQKVWPASLEVQGKYIEMGQIKPNGGAPEVKMNDNDAARQQARKPAGEWNSIEVVSKAGALSVKINGTPVCQSEPGTLHSGAIGFQAEGAEVHFRNVRMMVPDSTK